MPVARSELRSVGVCRSRLPSDWGGLWGFGEAKSCGGVRGVGDARVGQLGIF